MATIAQHERLEAPVHLGVSVVICAYSECRWDALVEAVASARDQNPEPDDLGSAAGVADSGSESAVLQAERGVSPC